MKNEWFLKKVLDRVADRGNVEVRGNKALDLRDGNVLRMELLNMMLYDVRWENQKIGVGFFYETCNCFHLPLALSHDRLHNMSRIMKPDRKIDQLRIHSSGERLSRPSRPVLRAR